MTVYSARRIVRQSAPLLAGLLAVQVAAGQVLNLRSDALFAAPVLLVLVPAVNAVGGNVGTVLGARISSGLHLGVMDPSPWNPALLRNVGLALVAGFATYAFLAATVAAATPLLGVEIGLTLPRLVLLVVLTGLALTASLAVVAVAAAVVAFRRGVDPDNAVIPVVTSVGDLLGIIWLIVVYGVIT